MIQILRTVKLSAKSGKITYSDKALTQNSKEMDIIFFISYPMYKRDDNT